MTGASASWAAVATRPSAAHALHSEGRGGADHAHRKGLAAADPVGDDAARELTQEAPDARQRDDDADLRERQVAVREVQREERLDDAAQPVDGVAPKSA